MGGVEGTLSCPRCGAPVQPPDRSSGDWQCEACGPVQPLYVPSRVDREVLAAAVAEVTRGDGVPLWCPWPLPDGWLVTGVGWVADDRVGACGSVLACSGPSPVTGEPADLLLVAESPGVGLAGRYVGSSGPDFGSSLADAMAAGPPHAKLKAGGHPTPMWSVPSGSDRSAYVGEVRAVWLVAVTWPATAGYLLADDLVLLDLAEWLPPEIAYGPRCARLEGVARNE